MKKQKPYVFRRTLARFNGVSFSALAEQRLPMLQLHELYGALAVLDVRPPKEL
jgi:hypothetical protein